jgi:hypothetical protein
MKQFLQFNKAQFALTVLLSFNLFACGSDDEVTEESMAGETSGGETAAGEMAAGETAAGETVAGETVAGETVAGETVAGEMAGATDMQEEAFVCAQDILQVQTASVRPSPNFTYLGIDDRFNFNNILQIEFTVEPVQGQAYTLEGQTPSNYTVGVFVGAQCTEDGCAEVYFASGGEITFSELGASGQELAFDISGLLLSRVNRDTGMLDSSAQVCLSNQEFRAMRPTEVGDSVPDNFALQNCETGDMVNVKEFGTNAQGIWYFATAGWCPACRQTLTYLFAEVFPTFTAETIRPRIVVSEDDQAEPATLAFCRSYAARYADSAEHFYVDARLNTTFENLWAYFGDDGSFGLPWQAVIEGGTGTYLYADGAPGPDTATDVINRLLE